MYAIPTQEGRTSKKVGLVPKYHLPVSSMDKNYKLGPLKIFKEWLCMRIRQNSNLKIAMSINIENSAKRMGASLLLNHNGH